LLKEANSFTNLLVETAEVVEITLNFLNGQINEHTSDLGCISFTDELFDEAIDELSNHLLKVRVLGKDSREKSETLLVVSVDLWVLVLKVGSA
jgi:hypothetical protein